MKSPASLTWLFCLTGWALPRQRSPRVREENPVLQQTLLEGVRQDASLTDGEVWKIFGIVVTVVPVGFDMLHLGQGGAFMRPDQQ